MPVKEFMKLLKYGNLALALKTLVGFTLIGPQHAEAAALYVSSFNNSSILRFDGETGEFVDTFVPSSEGGLADRKSVV